VHDAGGPFVARYFRDGKLVGVFAANAPEAIVAARRELNSEVAGEPGEPQTVVRVDRDVCIGNGRCARLLPTVFELDDEGIAEVKDVGTTEFAKLKSAELACPSGAIHVDGDDGRQ
jgi:ferredoxin